jgi:hypothetical protein
MTDDKPYVVKFGNFVTLPLYCMQARLTENLEWLSKGRASVEYVDPDYIPQCYEPTAELLNRLGREPDAAMAVIKRWHRHRVDFMYFVQFKNDTTRERIRALQNHTDVLTILCDTRLKLDPTPLWTVFDGLFSFANVHSEYREDPDRDARWNHYANRLKQVHDRMNAEPHAGMRLTQRMIKQIQLQATRWAALPPIHSLPVTHVDSSKLELFYSYSHKDDVLRDQLQTHLSNLKRQGVIAEWHDGRISAGREWEDQIVQHLNTSHIILLLISADFLESDFCYRELTIAMERHHAGEARVIPVILRACDWHDSPCGKLQAVPTDGKPVTSWQNIDEAFTNVARSIRQTASELTPKAGRLKTV